MKKTFSVFAATFVLGCASGSSTTSVIAPSPVVPSKALSAETTPKKPASLEMSFGLPDSENWREADRHDSGFKGWTPDLLLRNDKLDAAIAFLRVPSAFGSPAGLAIAVSRKYEGPPIVTTDASGRQASFTHCGKIRRGTVMCGKVYVIRIDDGRQGNVVLLGAWPERSRDVAERDIDEVARTFRVAPAK